MTIKANGKSILLIIANEMGFKSYQRKELAEKIGIDKHRLSIWKQRDNIPERSLIALSILLNQKINAIIGKERFATPVTVTGSYRDIEQQLFASNLNAKILDNLAKAYGFPDKSHAKFSQLIRSENEYHYYNILHRGDFPSSLIIKAHIDTGIAINQLVSGEVIRILDHDNVKSASCISFNEYMRQHYDGSISKAAKANKTQRPQVNRWLNQKHLVIGDDLYVSVRGIFDSENDIGKIIEAANLVKIYTIPEYVNYKHGGKNINLADQANVTKQAVDYWNDSNKIIIEDTLFSHKRNLKPLI